MDGELRVWEAFPNPVPHASGGLHRIVFRCLSDPGVPVRVTPPLETEALEALFRLEGPLSELLTGAERLS